MSDESTESLGWDDHIDQICNTFERCWRSGNRPRIEDYLVGIDRKAQAELLKQLLLVELELRRAEGQHRRSRTIWPGFRIPLSKACSLRAGRLKVIRTGRCRRGSTVTKSVGC